MPKTLIHVGFAHSGTKSLQKNFFQKVDSIFYAGVPYKELGGIFSFIKYNETFLYQESEVEILVQNYITLKAKEKSLVLSDESFVDQPAIYYTPKMVETAEIAKRLSSLFGKAYILFTIRNPVARVISNYLIYKKNCLNFDRISVESCEKWILGNFSQLRNIHLRNINVFPVIKEYEKIFGKDNIFFMPLERLINEGHRAYLKQISELLEIHPTQLCEVQYPRRNATKTSKPILNKELIQKIKSISKEGTEYIIKQYGIPLHEYGYLE